jgi:hypothetical protein
MLTDILLLLAHTFHREQDARRNGRLHISCLHIHPCSYSFSMLKCFIGNKALVETKSNRSSYSRLQAMYSGSWKRNRKTCTEETLVSQPSPAQIRWGMLDLVENPSLISAHSTKLT